MKEKIKKAIKELNGNNLSKYLVLKTIDEVTDADNLPDKGGTKSKDIRSKKGE